MPAFEAHVVQTLTGAAPMSVQQPQSQTPNNNPLNNNPLNNNPLNNNPLNNNPVYILSKLTRPSRDTIKNTISNIH
jgi:hypothetical protein